MVCLQCEKEIKGFAQRVPRMNQKKEKIDVLLEHNAAGELEKVDWDRLNAAIAKRLDNAQQRNLMFVQFIGILKMAALFAATVSIIVSAVIYKGEKTLGIKVDKGKYAAVRLENSPKGSASVRIEDIAVRARTRVEMGSVTSGKAVVSTMQESSALAKARVDIIDTGEDFSKKRGRAAWIIISRPVRVYADNGVSDYERDVLCLF